MSSFKVYLLNVLAMALSFFALNAAAATVVVTAPAPKEVIVVPPGSIQCKRIPPKVRNSVYIDAHRVCYARHGHVQWVSGHWECPKFNAWKGTCRKWVWVPSYWKGRH